MESVCSRKGCEEPRRGKSSYCRDHRNQYMREYWARPENKAKLREKNFNRRGRSISIEEYDALLQHQQGRCAICGRVEYARTNNGETRELCIDHCHETGTTRGLLCSACNRGLGMFQDDPELLRAAASYLLDYKD